MSKRVRLFFGVLGLILVVRSAGGLLSRRIGGRPPAARQTTALRHSSKDEPFATLQNRLVAEAAAGSRLYPVPRTPNALWRAFRRAVERKDAARLFLLCDRTTRAQLCQKSARTGSAEAELRLRLARAADRLGARLKGIHAVEVERQGRSRASIVIKLRSGCVVLDVVLENGLWRAHEPF